MVGARETSADGSVGSVSEEKTEDKWIIYHGDAYYPDATEYTDELIAKREWEKLKKDRAEDPDSQYVDKDYLAKIIEENGKNRWE
jgi:hypothetical protein